MVGWLDGWVVLGLVGKASGGLSQAVTSLHYQEVVRPGIGIEIDGYSSIPS